MELVLKNKSNSFFYHAVNESVTMSKSLVGHIPSSENIADLMKKVRYSQKMTHLVGNILHDIHDEH